MGKGFWARLSARLTSVRTGMPLEPFTRTPFSLSALVDAGDVQVDPGGVVDELLEEESAGDGAGLAVAHVLHVRHVALDLLLVLLVQGQLPELLARCLGGGAQPVAETPRCSSSPPMAARAEGDDNRAGEGGHVDDGR